MLAASFIAGCATSDNYHERAQSACEAEATPAAEMSDCVRRMDATLRAAQDAEADARAQAAEARHAAQQRQQQARSRTPSN